MTANGMTAWLPTDLCADIIINLGEPYMRHLAAGAEVVRFSNVDAQRSRAVTFVQAGKAHVIGIRFLPGGFAAFLPMPMQLISEQVLPLSELFGPTAAALEDQLYAAVSPEACVPLLDTFLLAHLGSSLNWSRALLEQVGRLLLKVTSCLKWPVGWAAASGATARQFCPKVYARVLRFQQVITALGRTLPLAGMN